MTTLTSNGPFRIEGVAPGNYKLFAVPKPNESVPFRSSEFIARHEFRALSVVVQKGKTSGGLQVPYLSLDK